MKNVLFAKIWKDDGHLADECFLWRENGLKIGFANGCFDLLHAGHIFLIEQAISHCDRLIIAVNSDESVRRLKGDGLPIQGEKFRLAVLRAIRGVDAITTFDEDTPINLIDLLQPHVLFKGNDYNPQDVIGREIVEARGGKVVICDRLLSTRPNLAATSHLISRAREGWRCD